MTNFFVHESSLIILNPFILSNLVENLATSRVIFQLQSKQAERLWR